MEVPDGVEHDVVREGTVPGFGATLCVDDVVGGRELVQEVEGFEAEDELAFREGLAEGGVDDEVVAIEGGSTVATTTKHLCIGGEGEAPDLGAAEGGRGIAGFEAVVEVEGGQRLSSDSSRKGGKGLR